jgi:hypothetical protein
MRIHFDLDGGGVDDKPPVIKPSAPITSATLIALCVYWALITAGMITVLAAVVAPSVTTEHYKGLFVAAMYLGVMGVSALLCLLPIALRQVREHL